MPSASTVAALTSPLIGPSTIAAISLITSLKSRPSLAIIEGLVVTPQITPYHLLFFISSTLAVSKKKSHIILLLSKLKVWKNYQITIIYRKFIREDKVDYLQ